MRRMRILAGAATTAVATVTLATSFSPALGSARALSAVSGVIAPKTANKSPVVRVNQVGYPTGADDYTANSLLAFALGGADLG
jgi:hypothetical protein